MPEFFSIPLEKASPHRQGTQFASSDDWLAAGFSRHRRLPIISGGDRGYWLQGWAWLRRGKPSLELRQPNGRRANAPGRCRPARRFVSVRRAGPTRSIQWQQAATLMQSAPVLGPNAGNEPVQERSQRMAGNANHGRQQRRDAVAIIRQSSLINPLFLKTPST